MRVLHTIDSLAARKGGTSRSVPRLARALADHGLDVALADAAALPVADGAVDVIHDHGMWLLSNHRSAALASKVRVPFVVSPRGMLEPWSLEHHRWRKTAAWSLYQRRDVERAAMLHATSALEATNLRRLGLRHPIATIPNGIDIPERPDDAPRAVASMPRTALFLSRIHPKKGLLDLVRAWASARPPGWRVVIAGPDEARHERDVRESVSAHGLDDVFSFVGNVVDAAKWHLYWSADLFVLPSHSENFGTVVLEALACEVPVITTKATPWESLETQRCGWCVDVGADALAAALSAATALSDETRAAMGRRGRAWVAREYAWASVASKMRASYEWLVQGGPQPECVDVA